MSKMIKEVEDMVSDWKHKAETPMDNMVIGMFENMITNMSEEQQEQFMYKQRQKNVIDILGGVNNEQDD